MAAALKWRQARRYFTADHPIPGNSVDWLRANFRVRRDVWAASEVWRDAETDTLTLSTPGAFQA